MALNQTDRRSRAVVLTFRMKLVPGLGGGWGSCDTVLDGGQGSGEARPFRVMLNGSQFWVDRRAEVEFVRACE